MSILTVQGLCKAYPAFQLKNVNFAVREGSIMGFIGRNGAGKTTTLKALQNLVHPTSGRIQFFGKELTANEAAIKHQVSFALGGANYYKQKRLGTISAVYRRFYESWDDAAYQRYLASFGLAEDKKIHQLSEGMKVKYALALALSHHARLVILDEPTSGLDPVSRDDLLEVFLDLVAESGASILFSTLITSDLEKCADDITYIQNGEILFSGGMAEMLAGWLVVQGKEANLPEQAAAQMVGLRRRGGEFNALLPAAHAGLATEFKAKPADLEAIMVYTERGHKA